MHANKREEIKEVWAGDIAAAVGLKNVTTGDTICDEDNPVVLEAMNFPEPVIAVAIEPKTKADQEKLGMALGKLMQEDPTFKVHTDKDTGQTMISRHGRAAPRDHRGPPGARVQRRRQRRQAPGRLPRDDHARRPRARAGTSGRPAAAASTATCKIRIEPAEEGHDFVFENEIMGGAIPKEFIKPIEQGIKEALETGILAGYPMTGVQVELYDGCYHDVDSSEMAFKIAGSMAFQDAAKKAQPILMEPIMEVEVVVPEDYMGEVIGDLSLAARPHRSTWSRAAGVQVITALVPLSEMFGYSTDLRSHDPGPRQLHDAVRGVRRGAEERQRRDHREGREGK